MTEPLPTLVYKKAMGYYNTGKLFVYLFWMPIIALAILGFFIKLN
jgi:hypothetical protein